MSAMLKQTTIKEVGKKMCNILHAAIIALSGGGDGRINSIQDEDKLTDLLRESFENEPGVKILPKTENRAFGDIDLQLGNSEKIYPINIKMVDPTKSGTYNAGSVKHLNYVLRGEVSSPTWDSFAKSLFKDTPTKCSCEYYYLIYYKNGDAPVFAGLTEISDNSIVTNPSNPIQLKKNIEIVERTEKEKCEFILGLVEEVLYKKAKPYMYLHGFLK